MWNHTRAQNGGLTVRSRHVDWKQERRNWIVVTDQITFVILMAEYGCTISLPLSVSYFVQLYVPVIAAAAVLVLSAVFRGLY